MVLPHDDVGAGAAVLLLHAAVTDRRMWSEHLQPLADAGHRAVAVDLPGFGEAPLNPTEDAPWNDVLATMDALDIGHATLVGNSFGGAVAQRVAVLAPERTASLALISSPASGTKPSPTLTAAWDAEEAALEEGDIEAAVEAILEAWLPNAPDHLRDYVGEVQRRVFELQLNAEPAPEGLDPLEHDLDALSSVDAPALIMVGEHDMEDFHAAGEALERALVNAQKTVLPDAGHLAPLEQPGAFREALLTFITAHRVGES
ncbi:MAG: alpha/beta hydrolase fold protein [Solirubrobacterales bacterium]|nr:alpha/beta hydrolase fold protein [Solirubrobacterales bacterium]